MKPWLDRVMAVPLLGAMFKTSFASQADYLRMLKPLLEEWDRDGHVIQIGESTPFAVEFVRSDGFTFKVLPQHLIVQLRITSHPEHRPPDPPKTVYSEILPFSESLDRAVLNFNSLFKHVAGKDARTLQRVGIVAQCWLDKSNPPPGIQKFIRHIGLPWGGLLSHNGKTTARLVCTTDLTDQCHHQLQVDPDSPVVTCMLDWQRLYHRGLDVRSRDFTAAVEDCKAAATAYYERFGAGEMDYASSTED